MIQMKTLDVVHDIKIDINGLDFPEISFELLEDEITVTAKPNAFSFMNTPGKYITSKLSTKILDKKQFQYKIYLLRNSLMSLQMLKLIWRRALGVGLQKYIVDVQDLSHQEIYKDAVVNGIHVSELARGGEAVVYRVENMYLDEVVAKCALIKENSNADELKENFYNIMNETQQLRLLKNENFIAQVKEEIIEFNSYKKEITNYCAIVERAQHTLDQRLKVGDLGISLQQQRLGQKQLQTQRDQQIERNNEGLNYMLMHEALKTRILEKLLKYGQNILPITFNMFNKQQTE
ncbi:UNKNOWN [Stylonychia lemnae]|uniref:Uncharacterized protein n=1 Tax=Stylonychia lemnae TaxID=5949 RepID=A0A077ZYD4_STYLE|nr:UNKNOWN [Stylonychia lemnae]|eukprot:CDW74222.1 UNKNOWN [Stylonychia lemnae]